MPILNSHRVVEFLEKERIDYKIIEHRPAQTTSLSARFAHVPGRMVMKSVLLHCDDKPLMLVLPATHRIDFDLMRRSFPCKSLHLASREELSHFFPDCMIDAIPPFGNLYDVPTLVEQALCEDDFVYFHPGVDDCLIEIHFNEYEHVLDPQFVVASVPTRFANAR